MKRIRNRLPYDEWLGVARFFRVDYPEAKLRNLYQRGLSAMRLLDHFWNSKRTAAINKRQP